MPEVPATSQPEDTTPHEPNPAVPPPARRQPPACCGRCRSGRWRRPWPCRRWRPWRCIRCPPWRRRSRQDLHVSGTLVGGFVATAYGVGIVSALLSPGMVRKYGGVRATQAVLLAAAGMLALAALGSGVTGLALAAVVLGLGYGAAAPASTHLLVPQTPQPVFNLVMSLRQIGVPFGGVMAALILPPLVAARSAGAAPC